MGRKVLCLLLTCGLLGLGAHLPAQSAASGPDPEVTKGIHEVDEGDYETAILTLDAAVRRLGGKPDRARDLGQAYLYLGIAYLGKGHETLAKAKFREALAQSTDLSLSPEKFAPRVLELFERAREEAGRTSPGPTRKKGRKTLVLVGVGGAAAAGIAVAASGGGNESGTRQTRVFTGVLTLQQEFQEFSIGLTSSGLLEAEVTWSEPAAALHLYVFDAAPPRVPPFPNIASGSSSGVSPLRLSAALAPGNYKVGIFHRSAAAGFTPPFSRSNATFTLRVTHP